MSRRKIAIVATGGLPKGFADAIAKAFLPIADVKHIERGPYGVAIFTKKKVTHGDTAFRIRLAAVLRRYFGIGYQVEERPYGLLVTCDGSRAAFASKSEPTGIVVHFGNAPKTSVMSEHYHVLRDALKAKLGDDTRIVGVKQNGTYAITLEAHDRKPIKGTAIWDTFVSIISGLFSGWEYTINDNGSSYVFTMHELMPSPKLTASSDEVKEHLLEFV